MIVRTTLRAALAALLMMVAVIAVRALSASGPAPAAAPLIAIDPELDADRLATRLALLLRLRGDAGLEEPASAARAALASYLRDQFPRTFALAVEHGGPGWVFAWRGRAPGLPPVVLLAHLDTVPVAGDPSQWTHAPFAGAVDGGYVWGRGALDDRASAFAMLEAVESLVRRGVMPARTVYVVLGVDEERDGDSARAAAAWLRLRHPEGLALVLDEGGFITDGVVRGVAAPVAMIGVAEKGYLTLTLTASGASGHAASPPRVSAIGRLSAAVARLEQARAGPTLHGPSAWLFEHVGAAMGVVPRAVFANLWLFRPLVARLAAADPRLAPLTRSTLAVTRIAGGVEDNVVSPDATATVNLRLLPGDTSEAAIARVTRVIDDDGVRVTVATPVTGSSAVTAPDGAGFALAGDVLRRLAPLRQAGIVVAPTLTIGSTDARWFAAQAAHTLRFVPFVASPSMLGGIHGVNERVAVADLPLAVTFYQALLEQLESLE